MSRANPLGSLVTTWDEALAVCEANIATVEARLDAGEWVEVELPSALLAELTEPPTAEQRTRAEAVLERTQRCAERVATALAATTAELQGLGDRRHAAREYTGSSKRTA